MSTSCWINGCASDQLSSGDRGLHYGDGLFETITCIDGRPRWLERHLQRLEEGCQRLGLQFDGFARLGEEISLRATAQSRCILKLILTRGVARRRGYAPPEECQPTRILLRYDWPPSPPSAAQHFRVGLSSVRLGINPLLAGLKHLNRLEQVLAQRAMGSSAFEEVLMLSSAGDVISGSMSNVFFADQNGLLTPAVDRCGVAGVMRGLVCAAASRMGAPLSVRPVALEQLPGVQEAFVTNVRWEVQSITELLGRALSGRRWAEQLRAAIDGTPR